MAKEDEIFQELASIDTLIHRTALLSIMAALLTCNNSVFFQRLTGLSEGNLLVHVIAGRGLLKSEIRLMDKQSNTLIKLTSVGKRAFTMYC
jgi:hypothetical protein